MACYFRRELPQKMQYRDWNFATVLPGFCLVIRLECPSQRINRSMLTLFGQFSQNFFLS